jgi:hypothetical protein
MEDVPGQVDDRLVIVDGGGTQAHGTVHGICVTDSAPYGERFVGSLLSMVGAASRQPRGSDA